MYYANTFTFLQFFFFCLFVLLLKEKSSNLDDRRHKSVVLYQHALDGLRRYREMDERVQDALLFCIEVEKKEGNTYLVKLSFLSDSIYALCRRLFSLFCVSYSIWFYLFSSSPFDAIFFFFFTFTFTLLLNFQLLQKHKVWIITNIQRLGISSMVFSALPEKLGRHLF